MGCQGDEKIRLSKLHGRAAYPFRLIVKRERGQHFKSYFRVLIMKLRRNSRKSKNFQGGMNKSCSDVIRKVLDRKQGGVYSAGDGQGFNSLPRLDLSGTTRTRRQVLRRYTMPFLIPATPLLCGGVAHFLFTSNVRHLFKYLF
ncbi:hypothetical protein ACFL0H_01595 [Thermodesulfobacteriota bacterium]